MAATQKLYPRGTVKRIVKAHSNRNVSKNADILVRFTTKRLATRQISLLTRASPWVLQIFLDYMLFMQEYALNRFFLSLSIPVAFVCKTSN